MREISLNRQKLGLEDLLFGVGIVTQIRAGQTVNVSKINAGNLPFNETQSLLEWAQLINLEVLGSMTTELQAIYDNLHTISVVEDNLTVINTLGTNITALQSLYTNIAKLQNIDTNMPKLQNIDTNMSNVQNIDTNMSKLQAIYTDLTKLESIYDNLTMLTAIYSNLTALNNINSQVIPNLTELLLVNDNAIQVAADKLTVATDKGIVAGYKDDVSAIKVDVETIYDTFNNSTSTSASQALTSRNQAETFAQQASASALSVDASNIVHRTENETIAGVKTFSSNPIVPVPTANTQVANKAYVDTQITGLGTAASRNVGTSAGQVMEVGAFGLGASIPPESSIKVKSPVGIYTDPSYPNTASPTNGVGLMYLSLGSDDYGGKMNFSPTSNSVHYTYKQQPTSPSDWVEFYHTGNLPTASATASGVVTTGNQTVAGVKTFSSNPISTSTQSTAIDALTRKDYVDTKVAKVTSSDNSIVRFDGTTGAVQSSGVIIDDNGNIGIGVIPSASTTFPAKESSIDITIGRVETNSVVNAYYNGSWRYIANGAATKISSGLSNPFIIEKAASGTAGNPITWNNYMNIDTSGNLSHTYGGVYSYSANGFTSTDYANSSINIKRWSLSDTTAVLDHQVVGVRKAAILANGTFQSATNVYGSTSDIKLKENIVDATPKLDKLMNVKVKNFNYIGQEDKQIGVIAQEIEEVFPSVVFETKDTKQVEVIKERIIPAVDEIIDAEGNIIQEAKPESIEEYTEFETQETGEVTKNVKYSIIYMMMLKGMQEQQEIINALKERIETLEGAK